MKQREEDFVNLLQSDARVDVLDALQDVDITDEGGTRSDSDQRIELAETGEQFRRIAFEDVDGEEIEYLTTLASSEYDPVEVIAYTRYGKLSRFSFGSSSSTRTLNSFIHSR